MLVSLTQLLENLLNLNSVLYSEATEPFLIVIQSQVCASWQLFWPFPRAEFSIHPLLVKAERDVYETPHRSNFGI